VAEVDKGEVEIISHHYVLRFDVPMHDFIVPEQIVVRFEEIAYQACLHFSGESCLLFVCLHQEVQESAVALEL